MEMGKKKLKLVYNFEELLQYSIERETHLAKFIAKQIQLGAGYNPRLQFIYENIVMPHYEQRKLSAAS